jgi:hypothetical protein
MPACHIEPADKKALVGAVGQELVRVHGKKKYYTPQEVRRAAETRGYDLDVHCWAYCVYLDHGTFDALHAGAGEVCDYTTMRASVLGELAPSGSFSWLDIDLSWLDWPDIDLSGLFDWFDFS